MKPTNKFASFFNALFLRLRHINFIEKVERVIDKMSLAEKIFFYIFSFIFVISGLILLFQVNNSFLVEVPSFGGSFTEGVVGNPRFINPVLAVSDTDKDLSALVYSGLLKISEDGSLKTDLADTYTVSEDGTVYDFTIKDNAYFHDGKKVTADDVVFTVEKILDPVIKSPKESNFNGVTVEKISDSEVKFTLKKVYTPFLRALTVGILPKHIWENASSEEFPFSQFNINPIGSGPYKIKSVSRNSGGVLTGVTLESWNKYYLGRSKIKNISFKFFSNETDLAKAYADKSIDSAAGLSLKTAKEISNSGDGTIKTYALPRVFGVFFNQNAAPVFLNQEVRKALEMSAPKNKIIQKVLFGFGKALNGPTPADIDESIDGNVETAKNYLLNNGWKEGDDGILVKKTKSGTTRLAFSISTTNSDELKQTAEILKNTWQQIGAEVTVKVFESGDLSQNVIKPRKYDALLFGEVVGADTDLYPFWHSSERNDPGLNISLYANITVDKMLEDIQKTTDQETINEKKEAITEEIQEDVPAVFLFSPDFIYAPSSNVKNIVLKDVASQNERFLFINKWFIETDKVWKIFVNN